MDLTIGIILTVFTLLTILSGVAMIIIARKRKKANIPVNYNKPFIAQWIFGIVLCLAGAIFMWSGDVFGENTTGIAQVTGIIGILLIATSGITLRHFIRRSDDE
ncbi:hypothetical protein ACFLYN_05320 [Chloroflexota bacterium]